MILNTQEIRSQIKIIGLIILIIDTNFYLNTREQNNKYKNKSYINKRYIVHSIWTTSLILLYFYPYESYYYILV